MSEAYAKYSTHKQTYAELSKEYGKHPKTLRKYFDAHAGATGEIVAEPEAIFVSMDATFFGRGYGILVCRAKSRNLYWKEIVTEKIVHYEEALDVLLASHHCFAGFVIDGRKGVVAMLQRRFPGLPIQLCQFHQIQIIKKYIPCKATTVAAQELRILALRLTKMTSSRFAEELQAWRERWNTFLIEKTLNFETGKRQFTHRRLRSAYRSLHTNLPYLFTFESHPGLPNTTNSCDGSFGHWKRKVQIHRGIAPARRKKMIDYLLENS
ncbi:MAG: hypothetical protein WCG83_03370 [Candidatus Peregrinibacteria bacterium]